MSHLSFVKQFTYHIDWWKMNKYILIVMVIFILKYWSFKYKALLQNVFSTIFTPPPPGYTIYGNFLNATPCKPYQKSFHMLIGTFSYSFQFIYLIHNNHIWLGKWCTIFDRFWIKVIPGSSIYFFTILN